MLDELRQVIPAFLARRRSAGPRRPLDPVSRRDATRVRRPRPRASSTTSTPEPRDEVTLTEFDPDGELKVVAAALYAASRSARRSAAGRSPGAMSADDRAAVLRAYIGDRANRRHKPGRAFERTHYRFDVLADYGAFRDLQRHRLLTLEWQPLSAAARLRRAGGHRRSRRARRLARGDGPLGGAA